MARQISGEDPSVGGSRFRRNLRLSATLADAPWGPRWPTGATSGGLGIPCECGASVATWGNVRVVGSRTSLYLHAVRARRVGLLFDEVLKTLAEMNVQDSRVG